MHVLYMEYLAWTLLFKEETYVHTISLDPPSVPSKIHCFLCAIMPPCIYFFLCFVHSPSCFCTFINTPANKATLGTMAVSPKICFGGFFAFSQDNSQWRSRQETKGKREGHLESNQGRCSYLACSVTIQLPGHSKLGFSMQPKITQFLFWGVIFMFYLTEARQK